MVLLLLVFVLGWLLLLAVSSFLSQLFWILILGAVRGVRGVFWSILLIDIGSGVNSAVVCGEEETVGR